MLKARISAVEYYLPKAKLENEELAALFPDWTAEKIEKKLGILSRPISGVDEYSSDLAIAAARSLFEKLSCDPCSIDFVLLCTQTPDYLLPTTACLIQARLGISKSAGALDFNLGCSGYIYGLGLAKGLIETGQAEKVLFLTAETYSKLLAPDDKGTRTLFGDAGSATVLEATQSEIDFIGPFVYGSDGSGGEHLIARNSAMRQTIGAGVDPARLYMNGGEVFNFGAREVSRSMNELLEKSEHSIETVDLFIFHQANIYMLDFLMRKCRIPEDKFMVSIAHTGNTVSNTIPIALREALASGRISEGSTAMLVGFGVGFSWGSCLIRL